MKKNFVFKKLGEEDISLLHNWMKRPHLQNIIKEKYLENFSLFKDQYLKAMSEKDITPYLVFLQGKPIGYIHTFEMNSRTLTIEQFIAVPEFINKGIGSMFLKHFTDMILTNAKFNRIIVDPSVFNLRAQRAYEKAGFSKLKKKTLIDGEVILMEKKKYQTEKAQTKKAS